VVALGMLDDSLSEGTDNWIGRAMRWPRRNHRRGFRYSFRVVVSSTNNCRGFADDHAPVPGLTAWATRTVVNGNSSNSFAIKVTQDGAN
jgi:hypothetical protein